MLSLAKSAQVLKVSRPKLNKLLAAESIEPTAIGNKKCLSREQIELLADLINTYNNSEFESIDQTEFSFYSETKTAQNSPKSVQSAENNSALVASLEARIEDLKQLLMEEKEDRKRLEGRLEKETDTFQKMWMVMQKENQDLKQELLEMPKNFSNFSMASQEVRQESRQGFFSKLFN